VPPLIPAQPKRTIAAGVVACGEWIAPCWQPDRLARHTRRLDSTRSERRYRLTHLALEGVEARFRLSVDVNRSGLPDFLRLHAVQSAWPFSTVVGPPWM